MKTNKILKLLLVLAMGVAVVFGISAIAGCKPEIVYHTVTFDSNGGSAIESVQVEDGKTVSKPADPTRAEYTFEGWFLGNEEYNFSASVTSDITLTAKWTEKTPVNPDITDPDKPDPVTEYTVAFDSNGGSAVASVKVEDGKTVSKPADPTRDGYIFEGWYLGNEEYNFSTPVTANITLTAKWTEKAPDITDPDPDNPDNPDPDTPENPDNPDPPPATEYTVTFNCNGGAIYDRDGVYEIKQAIVPAKTAVATPDEPVKAGYDFAGWFTTDKLTNHYYFTTPVTADITLYAKWTPKTSFTVTFNSNGGTEIPQQSVLSGGKAAMPSSNPVKVNYTFLGWCTDEECETGYNFDTAVRADLTLYAKWVETVTEPDENPDVNKNTYTYSYSAIERKADGTVLTQADFTGVNSFITIEDKVTYRNSTTSTAPDCILVEGGISVEFKGAGTITIGFASTSGSNVSSIMLKDSAGNVVRADGHDNLSVTTDDALGNKAGAYTTTGTATKTITFTVAEAGVYTIYCKYYYSVENSRGARIMSLTMTEVIEEAENN